MKYFIVLVMVVVVSFIGATSCEDASKVKSKVEMTKSRSDKACIDGVVHTGYRTTGYYVYVPKFNRNSKVETCND